MAGKNDPRHQLKNSLDRIGRSLETCQSECMIFQTIIKTYESGMDPVEKQLFELPAQLAGALEVFLNMLAEIQARL